MIWLVGLIPSASLEASGGETPTDQPFVFASNEYYTLGVADDITAGVVLGDLDLVVPGDRTENRYTENLANAHFAPPVLFGLAGPARDLAIADIDRDGRRDVLVSQRSAVSYCVCGRPGGFSEPVYLDEPRPSASFSATLIWTVGSTPHSQSSVEVAQSCSSTTAPAVVDVHTELRSPVCRWSMLLHTI